ncbi:MAG: hypothetical protein EKK61_02405 [Rickettsiales bacterium]|nr:MAG: hypothetical protein EKK61_02405 [Rickettsiales bacterium]
MMKIKNIKKKTLLSTVFLIFTNSAFALENEVKLGGMMEVTSAYYDTNGDKTQQKFSKNNKYFGFFSTSDIYVDYHLISENGWKYGTKIGLHQTTRSSRGAPFSLYMESDLGKIEVGSSKSAFGKMMTTGYASSCSAGNGWDMYAVSSPKKNKTSLVPYITNFCNFLDSKTRTSMKTDYSRKVTYYTPKLNIQDHKFQFGISYIPDSSNGGHDDIDSLHIHQVISVSDFKFAFKDGFAYGATYENKINDKLTSKLSAVGETGKTIAFNKKNNTRSNVKFKNLNTYNLGAEIIYDVLSFSGSYMNFNKSITNVAVDTLGSYTDLYALGTKYKFYDKKLAVSLNYFHSNNKNNKLDATSLGTEYNLVKGVKAHAQVTVYQTQGKYVASGIIHKDKSKGSIVILGGKVSF